MKPLTCCMFAIALLAASASVMPTPSPTPRLGRRRSRRSSRTKRSIVAHVDLTRVDPQSALDLAVGSFRSLQDELARAKEKTSKEMKTAIQAGVKEWYFVVTLPGEQGWLPRHVWDRSHVARVRMKRPIRAAFNAPDGCGRICARQFRFPVPALFFNVQRKPPAEFHARCSAGVGGGVRSGRRFGRASRSHSPRLIHSGHRGTLTAISQGTRWRTHHDPHPRPLLGGGGNRYAPASCHPADDQIGRCPSRRGARAKLAELCG